MSTEAAPVTEAPAAPETITPAVEAPATPVVAPVVIDPATVNFHDVSADERESLLFNPPPIAIAEVPAPAEVTPVEPTPVETPDPAAPVEPVVPVEPAPTAEEAEFIKNFRVHAPNKLASGFLKAYRAALEANPDANPAEIAAAVGFQLPQAAKPAVPNAVPGLPVATPEQTEIAAIDAKIAELTASTSEGTLMTPELTAAIIDLGTRKATLQIRGEIAAQRAADQQTATRTQARQASAAELLKQYPTANDSESLLGTEIDRQFLQIKNDPNHPDAAMLRADDGPARLIEKAAATVTARLQKTLGLTEAQARDAISGKPITEAKGPAAPATPTQPVKPKTPAPVPRTVLVTAPGGKSAPDPTPIDPTQLRDRASNDPKLRDELLGFFAPRIVLNQPVAK